MVPFYTNKPFPSYFVLSYSVPLCVLLQNLSYENEFDLQENEPLGGTHFYMNGFARRLVLNRGKSQSEMTYFFTTCLQLPVHYVTSLSFCI